MLDGIVSVVPIASTMALQTGGSITPFWLRLHFTSRCCIITQMAGNTLGQAFRVTNWGESHGPAIGATIDGCPAGIEVSEGLIQHDLDRRAPGQSEFTTARKESDEIEILSGVFKDETDGTPIQLLIRNKDHRSDDYRQMEVTYRPSHAGFAYDSKYGRHNPFGGGRSSARLTAGTVAAGAIAKRIIPETDITAYVTRVKDVEAEITGRITEEEVDSSPVRCPDLEVSARMMEVIRKAKENKDSVGGIIQCAVINVPFGLGEPVYDKLEADLAKAMLSIPASKGFEIGSGFGSTLLFGSENNDEYMPSENGISTKTNNSGGVQGGISIGTPIIFRVAFKPTATIGKEQNTVTNQGEATTIAAAGRHDPCVLPRAVPIVEGYTACVLADHALRNRMSRA